MREDTLRWRFKRFFPPNIPGTFSPGSPLSRHIHTNINFTVNPLSVFSCELNFNCNQTAFKRFSNKNIYLVTGSFNLKLDKSFVNYITGYFDYSSWFYISCLMTNSGSRLCSVRVDSHCSTSWTCQAICDFRIKVPSRT